jgi:Uma2 family endonuclease
MSTFVLYDESVTIPPWVVNLESFRNWARSDEFPETGRICYLGEEGVWVDMSKEQIFTHNQVKAECNSVLFMLTKRGKKGRYFPDGVLVSNVDADLSCQPDGCFVYFDSFGGRVQLVEGASEGFVELEGSPDMTLEIVSESSVKKDVDTLFDLYWKADVQEYWLIDARGERLSFDIYRHTAKGYVATRKVDGWLKSNVFGKSFRLRRRKGADGNPQYTLQVR